MNDVAVHTSFPTPVGMRGSGNESVSMGISNIDERDLGRGSEDGERTEHRHGRNQEWSRGPRWEGGVAARWRRRPAGMRPS